MLAVFQNYGPFIWLITGVVIGSCGTIGGVLAFFAIRYAIEIKKK